jgi:predicted PurR-regulated permease PerM
MTRFTNKYSDWRFRSILLLFSLLFLALMFLLPELARLVILGMLIAYLLDPAVLYIERMGLRRATATVFVFLLLSLAIAGIVLLLAPPVLRQLEGLRSLDVTVTTRYLDTLNNRVDLWLTSIGLQPMNLLVLVQSYLTSHVPDFLNMVPNALSLVGNLLLLPFIVFFMLKDGRTLRKGVISIVPNRYFEFTLSLLCKMDRQLGNYLRGQLIEALVVGVLSVFTLWLLDIPYYLPAGIFAGLANVVPYLGPLAGAIAAILITLMTGGSSSTVILIIALFALIQMLDNFLVQPLVIARNVQLHPLLVALTVIIGGQLFGFIGLLVAVPTVAVVKVFGAELVAQYRCYRLCLET